MGKYDGMTVNERLYESGLMDAFDNAKANGDREAMKSVLLEVGLLTADDGKSAEKMIDLYLQDN